MNRELIKTLEEEKKQFDSREITHNICTRMLQNDVKNDNNAYICRLL